MLLDIIEIYIVTGVPIKQRAAAAFQKLSGMRRFCPPSSQRSLSNKDI